MRNTLQRFSPFYEKVMEILPRDIEFEKWKLENIFLNKKRINKNVKKVSCLESIRSQTSSSLLVCLSSMKIFWIVNLSFSTLRSEPSHLRKSLEPEEIRTCWCAWRTDNNANPATDLGVIKSLTGNRKSVLKFMFQTEHEIYEFSVMARSGKQMQQMFLCIIWHIKKLTFSKAIRRWWIMWKSLDRDDVVACRHFFFRGIFRNSIAVTTN